MDNIDAPVKRRKTPFSVIPAKAGIQFFQTVTKHWPPVSTEVTTFHGIVNIEKQLCDRMFFLNLI
jgi:hypothetical protein